MTISRRAQWLFRLAMVAGLAFIYGPLSVVVMMQIYEDLLVQLSLQQPVLRALWKSWELKSQIISRKLAS